MFKRKPAKSRARKYFRLFLAVFCVLLVGLVAFFVTFVYRIVHAAPAPEDVGPSHFLLPSEDVAWPSADGTQVAGWWIPGRKGAPGVVLAPGFGMSRSDALSLAATLREYGFHSLIYDGSGLARRGSSTLGVKEADDMLAAIDFTASRPAVDGQRLGVWGVDVGARAALLAAGQREVVRAVAADSAYDTIGEYLNLRVQEETGLDHPFVQLGCRYVFTLYQFVTPASLRSEIGLDPLADRSVLFIQGENRKSMALLTAALYERLQPQKEMISLSKARVRMMNAEMLEAYDRRVANFFHLSLSKPVSRKQIGLASQSKDPGSANDESGVKSIAADQDRTKGDHRDP